MSKYIKINVKKNGNCQTRTNCYDNCRDWWPRGGVGGGSLPATSSYKLSLSSSYQLPASSYQFLQAFFYRTSTLFSNITFFLTFSSSPFFFYLYSPIAKRYRMTFIFLSVLISRIFKKKK